MLVDQFNGSLASLNLSISGTWTCVLNIFIKWQKKGTVLDTRHLIYTQFWCSVVWWTWKGSRRIQLPPRMPADRSSQQSFLAYARNAGRGEASDSLDQGVPIVTCDAPHDAPPGDARHQSSSSYSQWCSQRRARCSKSQQPSKNNCDAFTPQGKVVLICTCILEALFDPTAYPVDRQRRSTVALRSVWGSCRGIMEHLSSHKALVEKDWFMSGLINYSALSQESKFPSSSQELLRQWLNWNVKLQRCDFPTVFHCYEP